MATLTESDREFSRLSDEIEQLRTSLECSTDEVTRLIEDRDRLLRHITSQARELQLANAAYAGAVRMRDTHGPDEVSEAQAIQQEQEELRVAFEEMQVLTEELESANNTLHEANRELDRRVEERTQEVAAKNAALAASELRFRTLVEGMPQLAWRADEDGQWTWSSPQWARFTGLDGEHSNGPGWLDALHPDDRECAQQAWLRAGQSGELSIEARIRDAESGGYRWFQTRAMPVRDKSGTIVEWLGTSTDVHEMRDLQEQQNVLVGELQHRTRNLMGVILAMMDMSARTSSSLQDFLVRYRDRSRLWLGSKGFCRGWASMTG